MTPIPDDAIGMCHNGHVLLREQGSVGGQDDGWRHVGTAAQWGCSGREGRARGVKVIGTRSKP